MNALHSVSVAKVAELLDLNNLTKEMNLKERAIECSDVNRPALQLSGYFDHFEERRIQIIGNVEYTYIEKMSNSEKRERYSRFMEFDIPCIIFCRDLQPDEICYVGDSYENDMAGAKKAGWKAVWFNHRDHKSTGEMAPDYVVKSERELAELLEGI